MKGIYRDVKGLRNKREMICEQESDSISISDLYDIVYSGFLYGYIFDGFF